MSDETESALLAYPRPASTIHLYHMPNIKQSKAVKSSRINSRGAVLADVANEAGLTISTVSQILNGKGGYRLETQARVRAAAARLGYQPNASARAVRSRRFDCIGLVLPHSQDYGVLFSQVTFGVDSVISQRGMHLALCSLPSDEAFEPTLVPKLLSQWMVDGVLMNYHGPAPRGIESLIGDFSLPAVWLNAPGRATSVVPDDYGSAAAATRHFILSGHRRIAYFNHRARRSRATWHHSARDREDGFVSAMKEAGLHPQILGETEGVYVPYQVEWLVRRLRVPDAPTAILCYTAPEGLIVSHALAAIGWRLGRELSVIIHHDQPFETPLGKLDVWMIDGFAMGVAAAIRLLAQIDGQPDVPGPIRVPMHHLSAGSCQPPG